MRSDVRELICSRVGAAVAVDVPAAPYTSRSRPRPKVSIEDFLYAPSAITVPVGTKITFTNKDAAPHTATSGRPSDADGVFDTGTLTKSESKSVTLTKAGTFAYYCALHPFMDATVTVR